MPDKAPSPGQLSIPSGSPCVFFGPVSIPQIAWLFPAGPPSILRVSTHHCSLPIRTLILPIASQFPEYAPVSPASTHSLCVRCEVLTRGLPGSFNIQLSAPGIIGSFPSPALQFPPTDEILAEPRSPPSSEHSSRCGPHTVGELLTDAESFFFAQCLACLPQTFYANKQIHK